MKWRSLNAITEIRRAAADVVGLADIIIYSQSEAAKEAAMRSLPGRVRTLRFRANRLLTALEAEDIG